MDLQWKDGKLTGATIRFRVGGPCRVRYQDNIIELRTEAGKSYPVRL